MRIIFLSLLILFFTKINAQQYESFTDNRDGKIYRTVKIGEQIWMAENLNVESFNNGDLIVKTQSTAEWIKACEDKSPAWCYVKKYESDSVSTQYGKLYNMYAVSDQRGLCPVSWHVPKKSEWDTLISFLGGGENASRRIRSQDGWESFTTGGKTIYNSQRGDFSGLQSAIIRNDMVITREIRHSRNGTNTSGFTALPGGNRQSNGKWSSGEYGDWYRVGLSCFWWCAVSPSSYHDHVYLSAKKIVTDWAEYENNKTPGFYLRCIKDK